MARHLPAAVSVGVLALSASPAQAATGAVITVSSTDVAGLVRCP
ncbi:hypothetical protein ABT187_15630 [Streptomyces sp. NPDC001817]